MGQNQINGVMIRSAEWSSPEGFISSFNRAITEVKTFRKLRRARYILVKVTQGFPWFAVIGVTHYKIRCVPCSHLKRSVL